MHAQLVSSACMGVESEFNKGLAVVNYAPYHSVFCDSPLAVLMIYYLSRTIYWIAV
jgi:hypothetical protein